jgi:hypothetical protein
VPTVNVFTFRILQPQAYGGFEYGFDVFAELVATIGTAATCAHSSEPQIFPRELAHRGAAHQLHVALYFSSHQPERSLDAGLAGRS